ncbi:MAG: methionine adenosyltransferase [Clostridiales bacterium]|jgi:S-adenosylmethionine synthetase|nr:methionine adenosyltransferase [Clostridiales bacterium]
MAENIVLFTSESVTEGHPDKVCDQIADHILDEALRQDRSARIACEVCATTGLVLVMGEFTLDGYIDIPTVVRRTVKEIGYTDANFGFDYKTCAVLTTIDEQSPDISQGVTRALEARENAEHDRASEVGAGDQGMMFGYATNETPEYMPLPIVLSHRLAKRLAEARKSGELAYLRPDGKAQVTVAYRGDKPLYVACVVVSAQHDPGVDQTVLKRDILEKVIRPIVGAGLMRPDTDIYVNPTGKFEIGGPQGDSGLTGRKIIVDTYGGMCPHGGGSFSGKDPTKVDRSASYYARYVCKNLVAAGLCERVQLQVAYAIGKARPVSLNLDAFGTERYPLAVLYRAVETVFDFRPYAIIEALSLQNPIYADTAAYGHFGRADFPWEATDKTDALESAVKKILNP